MQSLIKSLKSYNTTAIGFLMAGVLLLENFADLMTSDQFTALSAAAVALIGMFAKDGSKSTEDVTG